MCNIGTERKHFPRTVKTALTFECTLDSGLSEIFFKKKKDRETWSFLFILEVVCFMGFDFFVYIYIERE